MKIAFDCLCKLVSFVCFAFSIEHAKADVSNSMSSQYADMGPGCRIKAEVPYDGKLIASSYKENYGDGNVTINVKNIPGTSNFPKRLRQFSFGFSCYENDDSTFRGMPVRFDAKRNKWVKDMNNWYASGYTPDAIDAFDNILSNISNFSAVNSKGFTFTEDVKSGPPSARTREFHFCLIHPPKAICGSGTVLYLQKPKDDFTPYMRRILNSIEFLGDEKAETVNDHATLNSNDTP